MSDDLDAEAFDNLIDIAQHTDRVIAWTLYRVLVWFWWPWASR